MHVDGIEIFRAGVWNGDKYTEADLDEMVSNFGRVGFDAPVKLGHSDDLGEPAYGWVAALKRVGDKLIASLRDIPRQIYEAIKDRRFDAVSAEIFWNLKRNGKKFRRALKAVALLGAEIPAVAGLKPLRDVFHGLADASFAACRTYEIDWRNPMTQAEAGAEIDRRVRQLMAQSSLRYSETFTRVVNADTELKATYAGCGHHPESDNPGTEVDRLVKLHMRAHSEAKI